MFTLRGQAITSRMFRSQSDSQQDVATGSRTGDLSSVDLVTLENPILLSKEESTDFLEFAQLLVRMQYSVRAVVDTGRQNYRE